jgi:hypothetical protein
MTGPSPRPLLFLVIDGEAPGQWKPWEAAGEDRTLRDLLEPAQLVEPSDGSESPRAISFELMLDNVAELLASKRLERVVGAIINFTADPEDEAFYNEKLRQLAQLCAHIKVTSPPDALLVRKLNSFRVWLLINDFRSARWARWDAASRDVVAAKLLALAEVEYVPLGDALPMVAENYLKNMWYYIEKAGLP